MVLTMKLIFVDYLLALILPFYEVLFFYGRVHYPKLIKYDYLNIAPDFLIWTHTF